MDVNNLGFATEILKFFRPQMYPIWTHKYVSFRYRLTSCKKIHTFCVACVRTLGSNCVHSEIKKEIDVKTELFPKAIQLHIESLNLLIKSGKIL